MARNKSNELEFQGQVLNWMNEDIRRRSGLGLDKATQEKPRSGSGKRNDLVVWINRSAESAFLEIEIKTPDTSITDPAFIADAVEKAQYWNAPFVAIWNMVEAELYRTPAAGQMVTPSDAIRVWRPDPLVRSVDSWLDDRAAVSLQQRALEILDACWETHAAGFSKGVRIDALIFVGRLMVTLNKVRGEVYPALKNKSAADRSLRHELRTIATTQGFIDFVSDIEHAIAGQYGYRLIGQILFYFALRRKQPALPTLEPDPSISLVKALRPYWDNVRRYDYEALFRSERIDDIVPLPIPAQQALRLLIKQLGAYDWNSLRADVLGSVFEQLIPHEEQMLLGQFYTPIDVADLLIAFAMNGSRPLVLDPGCGSGTFLMRAYDYLAVRSALSHQELLSVLWGFDLSAFATELASINLYRQNLTEFDNFPRVVPGDFFQRKPGQRVEFPPPHASGPDKTPIPIPHFDVIIGNPPYLRSQNQDDLDPAYKGRLFTVAATAGYQAAAKTDLFAFFLYHSLAFMRPGSRIGFVTSASWLIADFGAPLQLALLRDLRLIAIISSTAESFFSQVDVNTTLIVAEKRDRPCTSEEKIRFVTLKRRIAEMFPDGSDHWSSLINFTDAIEQTEDFVEDNDVRVTVVPVNGERRLLEATPNVPRNWSRYLRAPHSYFKIFGLT